MNNQALWLIKHWGLAIGGLMSVSGLIIATPGNMQTWNVSQKIIKNPFLEITYKASAMTRINEPTPGGYKPMGTIEDNHELKGLGASIMILGTTILSACANSLKEEYQRLEQANWMVRQSEFKLADLEYTQGVEVDRWAIELEAQKQISDMLKPPKTYYEKEEEQSKVEPEFSRSATGFLAWLQQKAFKLGNKFEVRWCRQQSFVGKKLSQEEIIAWVTELTQIEQAEWLDEERKAFRLLDD